MNFNLTQLHSRQLIQGEEFGQVRRTFTIWLCLQDVKFKYTEAGPNDYDFRFIMYDPHRSTILNEDFEIHLLLLNRWLKPQHLSPVDQWIYFFTQAKNWLKLPQELQVKPIKRAMRVLEKFSEQEESYYQYLERFNIRAKELSLNAEYRQIQDDYDQAIATLKQLKAQNKQDKIKSAKKLIALNTMPNDQIADITGLTIEQINKLASAPQ